LPTEIIAKYRLILKSQSSRKDFYVPSDQEVISNYNLIKRKPNLELIYLVLATSGIRYIECLDFLKNFKTLKCSPNGSYVSYNIAKLRNTKNINNIYLPTFVYNKLVVVNNTYNGLRQRFKDENISFSLKYLRKWQYNFLLFNNIPESVADFIQGRVNKSISSNHYLAKSQQANFWYSKVVDKLAVLFHNYVIQKNESHTEGRAKSHFLKSNSDYSR